MLRKNSRSKNGYYVNRFSRNKEQALSNIEIVERIIIQNNAADCMVFLDREIKLSDYLHQLKSDFKAEYSKEILDMLKRDKLTHAKKQFFAKKILNQSAYLYHTKSEITLLNQLSQQEISYT